MTPPPAIASRLEGFAGNQLATSAVEFALVAMPFLLVLLMTLQMGIYYMAKASLDTGIVQAADSLVNSFYKPATPSVPTASQLKALVIASSGSVVINDTSFYVELRQFKTLSLAVLPVGNTVDPSNAGDILALRAQGNIPLFVPGMQSFATVRASALIRRQGH